MNTYYYIAYRKRRTGGLFYAGDGIWESPNKTKARKEIAYARGVPASRLVISLHKASL